MSFAQRESLGKGSVVEISHRHNISFTCGNKGIRNTDKTLHSCNTPWRGCSAAVLRGMVVDKNVPKTAAGILPETGIQNVTRAQGVKTLRNAVTSDDWYGKSTDKLQRIRTVQQSTVYATVVVRLEMDMAVALFPQQFTLAQPSQHKAVLHLSKADNLGCAGP